MNKSTKGNLKGLLPEIKPTEWKFILSITRAWTLREAARISGLSASMIYKVASEFYKKGRIRFLFDLKKANLIPLALIMPKLNIDKVPPFTVAIRDIYNMGLYSFITALVPPALIKKYIDWFNIQPLLIVRGYEYLRWTPLSPLSKYDSKTKAILPVFNFEDIKKNFSHLVEKWSKGLLAPDVYDLVLLQGRIKRPFARPLEIYREAKSKDPRLPNVSEQVLSYHFTKHVKAMWRGNGVTIFNDMRVVPIRMFYFRGKDAPIFARIISQLPGSFSAIIDVDKALVVGQFPCSYDEHIMRGVEGLSVEMPFGYFVQSSKNVRKVIPRLWKYVEGKRWVFKEELYAPITSKLET